MKMLHKQTSCMVLWYTNTTILRQTLHLLSHKEVTYHPKSVNFQTNLVSQHGWQEVHHNVMLSGELEAQGPEFDDQKHLNASKLTGLHISRPSCSKSWYRYPTEKSLSSEKSVGKTYCVIHQLEVHPSITLSSQSTTGAGTQILCLS